MEFSPTSIPLSHSKVYGTMALWELAHSIAAVSLELHVLMKALILTLDFPCIFPLSVHQKGQILIQIVSVRLVWSDLVWSDPFKTRE